MRKWLFELAHFLNNYKMLPNLQFFIIINEFMRKNHKIEIKYLCKYSGVCSTCKFVLPASQLTLGSLINFLFSIRFFEMERAIQIQNTLYFRESNEKI
jgi:hypothetical protein